MEDPKSDIPRSRPATGGNTILALFLGLLGLFEVSFDLLSMLFAFLGGLRLNAGSLAEPITPIHSTGRTAEEPIPIDNHITTHQPPTKAPVGVRIFAVLLGFLGLLEGTFGTLMLIAALLGGFILPLRSVAVGGALGVFFLLMGLVKLFLTCGLWLLKRWAFWATVGIVTLNLLAGIVAITQPAPTAWSLVADTLLPLAILIYFVVSKSARTAFRV